MNRQRAVVTGSALPVVLLAGMVGAGPAYAVRPSAESAQVSDTDAYGGERRALALLRRAVEAAEELGYSGSQTVTAWRSDGATTRVLEVQQAPGGTRTVFVHETADRSARVLGWPASGAEGLAGISDRALAALAAAYELRPAGVARVAGRSADVVVAASGGREAARIWVDRASGLLLRQDVYDTRGELLRLAAFLDVRTTADPDPGPSAADRDDRSRASDEGSAAPGAGGARVPSTGGPRTAGLAAPPPQAVAWREVVGAEDLDGWRERGWPCRDALAEGFRLLDARRGSTPDGAPVLHLTYGDGLTAVSVFLQRGRLTAAPVSGMRVERWGDTQVRVSAGWPHVLVWQGGATVITAVGDGDAARLRAVLAPLPRDPQPQPGWWQRLGDGVRSVLARLGG